MKNIRISDEVHKRYDQLYKDRFTKECDKVEYADMLIRYALEYIDELIGAAGNDDKLPEAKVVIPLGTIIMDPPPEPREYKSMSVNVKPYILPWRGMKWRLHDYEGIGKLDAYCGFTIGAFDLPHKMICIVNDSCIPLWYAYDSNSLEDMMREVEQRLMESLAKDIPEWLYKDFHELDIESIRMKQEAYNDALEAACGKRIDY